MKQSRNITAAVIEHGVSVLSLFIVYRIIIKQLGVESLGLWSILLSIFSLTNIGNAGFASSTLKFVAKYKAYDDHRKIVRLIETSLIIVLLTTLVMFLIVLVIITLLHKNIFTTQEITIIVTLLPWIVPSLFVAIVGRVYLSALDGLNLIHYRSYIGIASKLVFICSSIYGIHYYEINGLAFANFLQYLVILVGAIILLKKKYPNMRIFFFRFDRILFFEVFKYGYHFQVGSIFQMLIDPIAKFFLKDFGGLASVGTFEVIYKFFLQVRQLIVVVVSVFVPSIANLKEVAPEKIKELFKNMFGVTCIVSAFLFAFTFVLLPYLLSTVSIDMDNTILLYSVYIYWGLLANLIGVPPYMFNLGTGNIKSNTLTSSIMAATCGCFTYILGKLWQGDGVVIGWAFSQILANLILVILFFRKEKLEFTTLLQKDSFILIILNLLFVAICSIVIVKVKYNIFISLYAGLSIYTIYVLSNYYLINKVNVLFRQLITKVSLLKVSKL